MFDPPHNGHVQLTRDAISELELDLLLVVVSARPPHRAAPAAAPGVRLDLCEQAFSDVARVEVSSIEIERSGPGYMIDTLAHAREAYVPRELYLVMGADQLVDFERWHRWRDILRVCTLAVAQRPGTQPAAAEAAAARLTAAGAAIRWFTSTAVDASSTTVRAAAAAGDAGRVGELVPAQIAGDVLGLYQGDR